MVSLNEIKLTGNITSAPEIKQIGEGEDQCVVEATLIHNWRLSFEDKDEKKAIIGIKLYGKNARRFAQSVTTKTNILVSGHLETDTWRDGDQPRSRSFILVRAFQFNSPANNTTPAPPVESERQDLATTPARNTRRGPAKEPETTAAQT